MLTGNPRRRSTLAKTFVNARVGRLGMALTAREVESTPAGRGQYG